MESPMKYHKPFSLKKKGGIIGVSCAGPGFGSLWIPSSLGYSVLP